MSHPSSAPDGQPPPSEQALRGPEGSPARILGPNRGSDSPSGATQARFHDLKGRPRVFGILGGIASGKSTVSEVLAGPDGVILSADREAHVALESTDIQKRLVERFGPGVIDGEGHTDRAALARVAFGDQSARKDLEGWIHPVVRAKLWEAFRDAVERQTPTVVVDVPLLLESAIGSAPRGASNSSATSPGPIRTPAPTAELPLDSPRDGLIRYCDYLVFVDAPIEDRDARAVKNRGWQPGEVARRQMAQMPLDEKRGYADLIIHNDQGPDELRAKVRAALSGLDISPRSPAGERSD